MLRVSHRRATGQLLQQRCISILPNFKGESKVKPLGRVLPKDKTDTQSWRRVMEFRKPDMNIPVIYPSLKNLTRPVAVSDGPLEPTLPKNKYGRKVALAAYKASIAVTDVLLKFLPSKGAKKSFSGSQLSNVEYATKEEQFLLDLRDLRDWNHMSDQLELRLTYLEQLKPGQELLILGGGISGLSLAWFVAHSRPDVKIKLIEQSDSFGGWMQSETINKDGESTVFEYGPRTLLPSSAGVVIAVQMIRQLGLLDKLTGIPKKAPINTKGVYFNKQLVKLPNGLQEAVSMITGHKLFDGVINGLLRDIFGKRRPENLRDESVEAFISRRTNKSISDNMISAVFRGIYAGDVADLSARSTRLSGMYTTENVHGSSLFSAAMSGESSLPEKREKDFLPFFAQSLLDTNYPLTADQLSSYSMLAFKGGIQQIATHLGEELERKFPKSVKILRNTSISQINPIEDGIELRTSRGIIKGHVAVSTLPANKVSDLLTGKKALPAAKLSKEIPFASLAVIDFWFPKKKVGREWFGYLIPKSEDNTNSEGIIGVVFDSAVRSAAVPIGEYIKKDSLLDDAPDQPEADTEKGTTLTVMLGGPLWKDDLSEEEVLERAVRGLSRQLGIDIETNDYVAKVRINSDCIPQYNVGHAARVEKIQKIISQSYNNRLLLSGTSYGKGVGIGDCITDSLVVASRFSEQRKLLFADYYAGLWLRKLFPNEIA